MVSFMSGVCELCGAPNELATTEQCKSSGIDVDVAACVECVRRMNPAAIDTISIANTSKDQTCDAAVVTWEPLVPRKPGAN